MTSQWQQKDQWFHQGSESMQIFNEIWDGKRFFKLSGTTLSMENHIQYLAIKEYITI